MSQENVIWRKEAMGDEFTAMRLQKLEQQRLLFEKRQRRKRQEPLMVLANPDASLRPRRWWRREERLAGDSSLGNPLLQESVPEAHLSSGAHNALGIVSCSGDGSGERGPLASPTEADSSVPELEEVPVEDVPTFPPPYKEPPKTRRRGWPAHQQPGASAEEESESQDVGDEYESPSPGPDPGMDGDDLGREDLASNKGEDLKEKKQKSESPVRKSPAAAEAAVSEAPGGEVGAGSSDVGLSPQSPLRAPGPRLGQDTEAYVLRPALPGLTVQCRISRDKRGVDKGMFPFYYLYLEAADGLKETNILGFRGPQKMNVIIPEIDAQNQRISVQPQNGLESLLSRFQRGATQRLILLQNKTPLWSQENGTYALNFHGRVTQASVKNFQIVYPDGLDYLVLQFRRVAPDTFTMDFRFPLCPLQAFAICLSTFDGKLACA
ncbi:unnamed protein product [Nyctereutes procyonoides]|uniref:(raccoon dog) hypothetical protein n=1 Tax=Nyctereutes procyonoides TaxID=34880 RepID=A0A811ZUT5_NYCPR|nr:unnamed protein product [Nyctereutes procyonoides]